MLVYGSMRNHTVICSDPNGLHTADAVAKINGPGVDTKVDMKKSYYSIPQQESRLSQPSDLHYLHLRHT